MGRQASGSIVAQFAGATLCFAASDKISGALLQFRGLGDEKQTRRYFVSGIVQGVGFRYFVRDVAEKLQIGGYARNLFDGRVEVLAVASPGQHAELRAALERGPRFSSVSSVREEPAPRSPEYERGFSIESDA